MFAKVVEGYWRRPANTFPRVMTLGLRRVRPHYHTPIEEAPPNGRMVEYRFVRRRIESRRRNSRKQRRRVSGEENDLAQIDEFLRLDSRLGAW